MSIRNRFFDSLECLANFLFERVLGIHDMEDTSDFEEECLIDNSPLVEGSLQEDKDAPNLFVGKFIKDSSVTCEVISCEDDFRVMILKIGWDRLGTYLDVGQTYPLRKVYDSTNGEMKIWEVNPDTMKRTTSQVLLVWQKDLGWTWDLDF